MMPPTLGGAVAPLMVGYGDWTAGQGTAALPRNLVEFLSAAFSPLMPIAPQAIDQPEEGEDRPLPRRFQYPVGWNLPIGIPGTEGLKLASFANLRAYADLYSVSRACIELRKAEVLGVGYDIVPTKETLAELEGSPKEMKKFQQKRQQFLNFFDHIDPNFKTLHSWLGALLEELLVVDAVSLYLHPARTNGKGIGDSNLAALDLLDGTTIRPLLDVRGQSPKPPNPAYQQYLWGVPRVDLMDIVLERDIEEMGEPIKEYMSDQLLYLPYIQRTWTPYGFPPMERSIIPSTTGFKKQLYILDFFTEGTIPGVFVSAGPGFETPEQAKQLQTVLNAIAGDMSWKHKIVVLPTGAEPKPMKPEGLSDTTDIMIQEQVFMAFDVMPMELGVMPGGRSSGLGGKGVAEHSSKSQERKALRPLLNWLKRAIFDYVIQDIANFKEAEWAWPGLEEEEDSKDKTIELDTKLQHGVMTIDEIRHHFGLTPWGLPATSQPIFISQQGAVQLASQVGMLPPVTNDPQDPNNMPGKAKPESSAADVAAEEHNNQSQQRETVRPVQSPGSQGQAAAGHPNAPNAQDAKVIVAELRKLRNYLRHKRDPLASGRQ